jgi:hypothetical protein
VPLFLCNYHVHKAWVKNLNEKVRNEATRKAMFEDLCSLQKLQAFDAEGTVDKAALDTAVDSAAAAFVAKYAEEEAFCTYFTKKWWKKLGVLGGVVSVQFLVPRVI